MSGAGHLGMLKTDTVSFLTGCQLFINERVSLSVVIATVESMS